MALQRPLLATELNRYTLKNDEIICDSIELIAQISRLKNYLMVPCVSLFHAQYAGTTNSILPHSS
jgi:hypothetical protein